MPADPAPASELRAALDDLARAGGGQQVADVHNTISGGSYTGSNNVEAVTLIEGGSMLISGATVAGPGAQGLYLDSQASNSCVNNNTFVGGTGLGSAINSNGTNNLGLGNILNLLSSTLTLGVCTAP